MIITTTMNKSYKKKKKKFDFSTISYHLGYGAYFFEGKAKKYLLEHFTDKEIWKICYASKGKDVKLRTDPHVIKACKIMMDEKKNCSFGFEKVPTYYIECGAITIDEYDGAESIEINKDRVNMYNIYKIINNDKIPPKVKLKLIDKILGTYDDDVFNF